MRAPGRLRWRFYSLKWRLKAIGWPSYSCQQCVGQDAWQGCYCAYYGAVGPGDGNLEAWRRLYRWLYTRVFADPLKAMREGA
jgi:hypothetical protein